YADQARVGDPVRRGRRLHVHGGLAPRGGRDDRNPADRRARGRSRRPPGLRDQGQPGRRCADLGRRGRGTGPGRRRGRSAGRPPFRVLTLPDRSRTCLAQTRRPSRAPTSTPRSPTPTLAPTVAAATARCRPSSRSSVSCAKVEYVVYPPQKPTTSPARSHAGAVCRSTRAAIRKPTARQPVMLIVKVAHGKTDSVWRSIRESTA